MYNVTSQSSYSLKQIWKIRYGMVLTIFWRMLSQSSARSAVFFMQTN